MRTTCGALALALVFAASAAAAYPGKNGKIAFARSGSIYTVDANGKNLKRLGNGAHPSWSPDGTKIAFDKKVDGVSGIYVMQADGTSVTVLTQANRTDIHYDDAHPTWSADGKTIVFDSDEPPADMGCDPTAPFVVLYSVGVDGTGWKLFTPLSVATDICGIPDGDDWPAFSPKGDRVAFDNSELIVHEIYDRTIMVCDATGKNRKAVFSGVEPDWSPDGKKLTWIASYKGNAEVWTGTVATKKATRLTRSSGGNTTPAWSPDGKKIVFARSKGSTKGLLVLDLKSGKLTKIASSGDSADWQPLP